MSEPKDKPDTPATIQQWLDDHDNGKLDKQPPNMGKDAQDAQS